MTTPRKGTQHLPELTIMLRDAQPLMSELQHPDAGERRAFAGRRDIARDELVRMYRDAEREGAIGQLDPGVRLICEQWKRECGGVLPARKGGRPQDEHARLLIWMRVHDAIDAGRGSVKACRSVAENLHPPLTYEHVRDIWYDRDPEWVRLTQVTLAERQIPVRRPRRTTKGTA